MKRFKRFLLVALTLFLGLTITSCKQASTRNTTVPYGSLDLNAVVAQSSKDITLTNDTFYSRLRAKAYDIFTEEIKRTIYEAEINAITKLVHSSSLGDLTSEEKKVLSYEDTEIDGVRYDELKDIFVSELSSSLLTSIFSSTDAYTINSKTDKEKQTSIAKYVESMQRQGYTITDDNISYSDTDEDGTMDIDLEKIPSDILASLILTKAEDFYAQKELYKIADKEYLNEGTDDEEKNDNYLFKESSIISSYDSSYKTFGTYKAIIITFNSRREAMETMKVLGDTEITSENVLDSYLKLYNKYYSCYGTQTEDSDLFSYEVSVDKNELDDISSSVNTLITETLDNGEFLTEPRNLDDKYVLAYRISTNYVYEEKEFDELDEATRTEVERMIKNNLVKANSSSYITTAFKAALDNCSLEIYDPLFEYKFRNSYTDNYDLIDKDNENIGKNLIFKLNNTEFTVESFYDKASSRFGAGIVTEYFQQEYTLKYLDDFVTEETTKTNKETLEKAIKSFEKNENSTYPKEIGLQTYLLNAYGYETKDDVLKYYYQASSCMSSYKAKVLFDEWATDEHTISDEAKKVLERILAVGNNSYESLFSINVDHILINIDYDADGNADDPDKFISEHPEIKERFEAAVENLAQAIYREATYADYKDNSLYDTLAYIVNQYNKGAALLSDPTDSWDNYKTEFNFLLRAEQLASSSDITQDSVSSFVTPFADYIKDMYTKATEDEVKLDDNGNFFTVQDGKLTEATDGSKITTETLCKTVYGYHLIVLNDYDGPDSLKFTKDENDSNGYQEAIQVLISEDEDDETNNVYVTLSSYNESSTSANLNQLFIYYVQSKNGDSSSLDSNIESLLSTLFTDPIEKYSSSNFQTMVLLDIINITSSDEKITRLVEVERGYYANLVIDYDSESEYISWISKDMDWTRPNQK